MKWHCLVALLFVAITFAQGQDAPSDVVVLTTENFDSVINGNEAVMVEFYAPWCGHCQQLVPHYEAAATELKGKVVVAKVDATVETELAQKFGVNGYPTLKFFKNGAPTDFEGERTTKGIVSWITKSSLPISTTLKSAAELKEFVQQYKSVIVGFFDKDSEDFLSNYKEFIAAAASPQLSEFVFADIISASVVTEIGGQKNTIKFFRSFDDPVVYEGKIVKGGIASFIEENGYPVVDDVQRTWSRLTQRGKPIVVYFVESVPEPDSAIWWINAVGKRNLADFSFAHTTHTGMVAQMTGVPEEQVVLPTAIIMKEQKVFPYGTKELTEQGIEQFLKDYQEGKVRPVFKSEPIPESNDGDVTVVVGHSFESIVLDPTKHVLVEFYAPWCGHCKQLEPIYDSLGRHFKGKRDDVVIAKIDSTANDNPSVQIEGFPTIYLFPAGEGAQPIAYEGPRTLKELAQFVEQHAGGNTADQIGEDEEVHEHDDDEDDKQHKKKDKKKEKKEKKDKKQKKEEHDEL